MSRRALVIGGKGMLARELVPALVRGGWEVDSADIEECDITRPPSLERQLSRSKPDLVANCAAYTQVDRAEQDEAAAFAVNAAGAGNVARACAKADVLLLHLSTDYVFDGKKGAPYLETDPTGPLGVYARSKLAGEEEVRGAGGRWTIARTGELYGDGPNFFAAIFGRAKSGLPLRVVNDQFVGPTWTRELAAQLVLLIDRAPCGLYHATCSGETSWCEAAREGLRLAGLEAKVTPVSTEEYGSPTPRPRYTVLAHQALERLGLYCMRPWKQALADWLGAKAP
ncbi:MAG: dTDP-4-dehydrorhamnose reductase [Myxococcales bacterium]|nr:dTDP-4-dehydrorhamnose reductase [Myxococcales bacterium]